MDDFKREIYMLARKLIEEELEEDPGYNYGICIALRDAATKLFEKVVIPFEEISDWFPEFTNLSDGRDWTYERDSKEFYAYTPKRLNYWWYIMPGHRSRYGKKNPRLSALDFVLTNR